MKVKVECSKEKKANWKEQFPHLGIYSGTQRIVLFTAPGVGVVIRGHRRESTESVGHYSTDWASDYERLEGEITLTLQND